ncbi:hypothetical protein GWK47_050762 [Chionoecetes opilio]|uniref:Uncharacterized protein n=1 Tax=Chionoecetes opilio TaxID=41210 RepID=A0A8J4Y9S0_CHIOP|nr:hypothetical protein GWK47_050762 [Chionoecetes opilio]
MVSRVSGEHVVTGAAGQAAQGSQRLLGDCRKLRTSCWFLSSFASVALSDYAGPVYGTKLEGQKLLASGCESLTRDRDSRQAIGLFDIFKTVGTNSQCWRHLTRHFQNAPQDLQTTHPGSVTSHSEASSPRADPEAQLTNRAFHLQSCKPLDKWDHLKSHQPHTAHLKEEKPPLASTSFI